jgi:protein-L-isoaspartate O-methyltransferase
MPLLVARLFVLLCWAQTALAQVHAGPYVPSPAVIVDEMLALAAVREGDFLVDLGSGDGRIVITAAQRYGARGYGVDIDPKLVALANENARRAGLGDRVSFEERDLFVTDLGRASVVTIYLLPGTVTQLVEKLRRELRPGARVVSHDYPLVPWREDRTVRLEVEEKVAISGSARTVLYLYTVPAQVGGEWSLALPRERSPRRLVVTDGPFRTAATLTVGGRPVPLAHFAVHADDVVAEVRGRAGAAALRLVGKVHGDVMEGTVERRPGETWRAKRLPAR